ncbi:MAG: phosphotyrosine protein phosphatase [Rubrivivax sp.]|nr:phosphotyrosine protein phosphatase [Rubrivivax sp.]
MQALPTRRDGPIERWRALVDANHGTFRGQVRAALAHLEFVAGRLQPHLQLPATTTRLVFVCLGNINRSAFAESVARELGANTCSIGLSTTTGAPAFHKTIRFAPEFGLDLAQHKATDIGDYEFEPGDLLLVMEVRHARRLVARGIPAESVVLLGHWASPRRIHLHDPHVLSDAYFRTCFTLIRSAVHGLVGQLREAGSPCVPR